MRAMLRIVLGVFLLCAWHTSHAGTCEVSAGQPDNVLQAILAARNAGCFGSTADNTTLTKQILDVKNCTFKTRAEGELLRGQLVTNLRALADESAKVQTDSLVGASAIGGTMVREIDIAQSEVSATAGFPPTEYWQWEDSGHQSLRDTTEKTLLDYRLLVNQACTLSAESCAKAVVLAAQINRIVALTYRTLQCANQSVLRDSHAKLALLDKQWDYYFFKARSEFIWELGINALRFKGRDDMFAPPPNDQIIFLHPGVAFEYVGGGAQNATAYQATVLAEVAGYNRFKWGASHPNLPPLGASLVATYTGDNTGSRVGYGVMFHVYNTLSFGVTRRDTGAGTQTTYLLSADLMRLFVDPSARTQANFRGAGAFPAQ